MVIGASEISTGQQFNGSASRIPNMEIQLNEFENAAFAVFMNLLVRTIVHMKLNLLVPISNVKCSSV